MNRISYRKSARLVKFAETVNSYRPVFRFPVAKWWVAVERPALFQAVKVFVSALAGVVDSKSLIIHRENDLLVDAVIEGKGLTEIEAMIRASGSLPASGLFDLVNSPAVPIGMTSYFREDLPE